ncbi:MAG: S41 family peptidase, partial [Wenzhouxiangella sp.]|nr:S41 family peptidase [Wenzhouxiangella sp.]
MTQSPRLVICVGLLLAGVFILQITAQASSEPSQRLALVERVIVTAEAAVADPRWVTGAAWNQFKITLRSPEILALDDRSFLSAFNEAAQLLPFSHFRLHWQSPPEASLAEQPVVALDWPADDVALIRVRGFEGEPEVMAQMMGEVIAASARALIVDLRGNPGGSFPTAVALSRGLRREAVDAGAFLTRGWYARHGKAPDAEAYQMIAPLEVLELSAFAEQLKREGAARLVLPGHSSDIHQGRLVILTDGQT